MKSAAAGVALILCVLACGTEEFDAQTDQIEQYPEDHLVGYWMMHVEPRKASTSESDLPDLERLDLPVRFAMHPHLEEEPGVWHMAVEPHPYRVEDPWMIGGTYDVASDSLALIGGNAEHRLNATFVGTRSDTIRGTMSLWRNEDPDSPVDRVGVELIRVDMVTGAPIRKGSEGDLNRLR